MDITEVIQMAKDHLLEHGEHHPELWIEFKDKELTLMVFANFPYKTTAEKNQALFATGRQLGLESKDKEITQVLFIIETWVSKLKPGEQRTFDQPRNDPNRSEALIIMVLDADLEAKSLKQSMHIVEMLRDGEGNLVDLLHRSEQLQEVRGSLLYAFLAGFLSTKFSDEQLAHIIEQTVREFS
jgi:hypothetical protein